MNIRPLHNRILVKRVDAEEVTPGGLVIPQAAKEKPLQAVVVAVGTGKRLEDGTVVPLDVKEGDKVLIGKYSGNEIKIDGVDHLIMSEDEIFAVIE